jgi:hypothetical protein
MTRQVVKTDPDFFLNDTSAASAGKTSLPHDEQLDQASASNRCTTPTRRNRASKPFKPGLSDHQGGFHVAPADAFRKPMKEQV